jgi:cold shock CspA family protein
MPMFDADIAEHIRKLEQPATPRHQAEKPKAPGKYTGTIFRWSRHGYGFINPDQRIAELGDLQELFVGGRELRRSGIRHDLQHDDRVTFDLKKVDRNRWEASNISLPEAVS